MDELLPAKGKCRSQIQQLAASAKVLYRQKREPERAARERKIKSLTQQMKALRHEVYLFRHPEQMLPECRKNYGTAELAAQEEQK